MKTLDEWIAQYEKKAEKFILLPGFKIYYKPDKGFFCWAKVGNVLEIDHSCTNNVNWAENCAITLAKQLGCILLRTATFHDPAAYMRLTKAKINLAESHVRANGKMYWIFEKEVS